MIQIRGIVKAAQAAQSSLNRGIPSHSVASFQEFITNSVETIERLCAQELITPKQLPSRSRWAYSFLKSIDLDNLPVAESRATSLRELTLRLKNIRGQQRTILQQILSLASSPTSDHASRKNLPRLWHKLLSKLKKFAHKDR